VNHSASLRRARFVGARVPSILALACCLVSAAVLLVQSPLLLYLGYLVALICLRFPNVAAYYTVHPWVQRLGGMRTIGILCGTLVFCTIALHGDPAHAQLFKNAEQQTNSIFGSYVDASIVKFMFGLLRVVVWISAVGFVLFAVYQAQRGEQWQPLMQNAFIVIAAVVVVEGLSSMFFGGAAGGGARAGG
jgi:hypothetical protein